MKGPYLENLERQSKKSAYSTEELQGNLSSTLKLGCNTYRRREGPEGDQARENLLKREGLLEGGKWKYLLYF